MNESDLVSLAEDIWFYCRPHVPANERQQVARQIWDMLEDEGCHKELYAEADQLKEDAGYE